jgi:hypothetical protein
MINIILKIINNITKYKLYFFTMYFPIY